jgi:hypothetical protein
LASKQLTRRVVIGGQSYDKPWDPSCGACRSPWLQQIDVMLAEGYALLQIRKHLSGLKPACPNAEILRAHIPHLAGPHRKARMAFEAEAEARGDNTDSAGAQLTDALQAIVRAGSERLALGDLDIQAKDSLKAIQLLLQLQRSQAAEGVEASAWQAAFMEFFEIVRKHLTPSQWRAFVTDVYDSPAIRAVLTGQSPAIPGGAP